MATLLAPWAMCCLALFLAAQSIPAEALSLTGVQSRKLHPDAAAAHDLPVDFSQAMSGNLTIESRAIGSGHRIVFQFDAPVVATGTLSVIDDAILPVAGVSAAASGNEVVVTIPLLADNRRVTVSLDNVNGTMLNVSASLAFRVGDSNQSGSVIASDISAVKARAGQPAGGGNYQFDLNTSGWVTAADIALVKARAASSGNAALPPGNAAPVVHAGSSQSITLPATALLAGSASDDGLPSPPAALTLLWSVVSGPGGVTFGSAGSASTGASFAVPGIYLLRLSANDGQRTGNADVSVTVNPDPAPVISGSVPAAGAVAGAAVIINGANFTGATAVSFNGTSQPAFSILSASQITTTVPAGATSGPISVTTPNGTAVSATFLVYVLPTVVSSVPANGATLVQPATAITVNFSEPVNATASAFALECPVAMPRAFTIAPVTAAASFTLTPVANMPAGTVCRVTVSAALVTDVDTGQNMASNFVFNFTTGAPPAITSAGSVNFAPGISGQTFTITTTGTPANGISRSGTLPSGVTFTDNGNNTATVGGTPAAGTQGASPYAWVITASNGIVPNATQNFTFNVTCPAITVSGTVAALTIGSAMAATVFSQAGGNGSISWSASGLPAGVSIDSGNGQLAGTPTATGTFSATITATDAGGCAGNVIRAITVAPVANADAYSTLVDNTQFVVSGGMTVTPATPAVTASGRLGANDLPSGGITVTAGTFATSAGGSVTIAADGTFIYTPKANPGLAAVTSDSFTYTVSSNTGGGAAVSSAPATVSLTLTGRVWYVKNDSAGGNGQSQSTFNTLAAAIAASTANDIIFVYQGSGTAANLSTASVLKAGQRLIGQGAILTVNGNNLVMPAGFPLIGGTVTLASGVTVNGIDMGTGTGNGIVGASVTGVSVTVRDLTSTTGTAVSLTGAGNSGTYVFRSVSSSGGASGILLQNNTGSFTVTGNSTGNCGGLVVNNSTAPIAPVLADCTGGTIQNKATGIRLDNVQNVSLTRMRITGTAASNFGIHGTAVDGFTLAHSVIDGSIGALAAGQDGPLVFGKRNPAGLNGLTGTSSITDSSISGGIQHNMEFYGQSGVSSLAMARTIVRGNSVATGANGMLFAAEGTAGARMSIENSHFDDNRSLALEVTTTGSAMVDFTLRDSRWTRTTQGNAGVSFSNAADSRLTVDINNNIAGGHDGSTIFAGHMSVDLSALSKLHVAIRNNTLTAPLTAYGHTILVLLSSAPGAGAPARMLVSNNNVQQDSTTGGTRGIVIDTPNSNTNPQFEATVLNNAVNLTNSNFAVAAMGISARQQSSACMNISGNNVSVAAAGVAAILAQQDSPASASLFGSGVDAASVIAAANPLSTTEVSGTINLTGVPCQLPDSPLLP